MINIPTNYDKVNVDAKIIARVLTFLLCKNNNTRNDIWEKTKQRSFLL